MLEPDKREFVFYNSLSFEHPDYDIASSEPEKKYTMQKGLQCYKSELERLANNTKGFINL